MATGIEITTLGKEVIWNRTFKSTPDYTAVTQFESGTGTTTPTVSDTDLETGLSDTANFVSGWPTFQTASNQVTTRGYIDSATDNGNDISEVGEWNTDGSPILFSHAVFTAIEKTTSVTVTFIWKYRLVDI